jgi:hypothetical protein
MLRSIGDAGLQPALRDNVPKLDAEAKLIGMSGLDFVQDSQKRLY